MSFCPHCGKSVAEQAAKCVACGGELQPRGKGARFKGTMMMQPGQAPAGAPATPVPAAAPVPAIAKPAPVPAAAPVPEAQRSIAAAPSSKAKHTMIGTGGAGGLAGLGIAPPPGLGKPTVASVPPGAPPPAAGPSSLPPAPPPAHDPALADTGRNPTPVPAWDPAVSDPPGAPAARAPALRFDQESDPPQLVPGRKGGPIVALAIVGAMLLAALCYLIARFLGMA
ncbi:MAG TPA: hypothetical protein VK509_10800 [Polyangiales bacterium]|nr:hypothetical protein [Polyangiales bacterium]